MELHHSMRQTKAWTTLYRVSNSDVVPVLYELDASALLGLEKGYCSVPEAARR